MTVFLVLLLAHLIADFITQTSSINHTKRQFSSRFFSQSLIYHCLHHFVVSLILAVIFLEWRPIYLVMIFIITLSHYLIDMIKIKWDDLKIGVISDKKGKDLTGLELLSDKNTPFFIIDQLLHLVSIYLVLYLFNLHFTIIEFNQLFSLDTYQDEALTRLLVIFILLVIITYPAAYFISVLMSDFNGQKGILETAATLESENEQIKQMKDNMSDLETDVLITESYQEKSNNYALQIQYHQYNQASENPRGRYIGILERLLIVILVVQNLYQGLALIIAMKTLTRFKQFDDKNFAEYYLIGTLLSLIIGVITALIINKVW